MGSLAERAAMQHVADHALGHAVLLREILDEGPAVSLVPSPAPPVLKGLTDLVGLVLGQMGRHTGTIAAPSVDVSLGSGRKVCGAWGGVRAPLTPDST